MGLCAQETWAVGVSLFSCWRVPFLFVWSYLLNQQQITGRQNKWCQFDPFCKTCVQIACTCYCDLYIPVHCSEVPERHCQDTHCYCSSYGEVPMLLFLRPLSGATCRTLRGFVAIFWFGACLSLQVSQHMQLYKWIKNRNNVLPRFYFKLFNTTVLPSVTWY